MDTQEDVRVGFSIDRDTHAKLDKLLPSGTRSQIFRTLTTMIITFLMDRGEVGVAMLLTGKVKLTLTEEAREEMKKWQD